MRALSIDGGGIRGIIPALVLAEIERRTGRPIAQLFDIIVGTSTGGIVALGLAKPDPTAPDRPAYTAEDLVQLYEREGESIFPPGWSALRNIRRLFGPKYSARGLEAVLSRYFGDVRLEEALTHVEIPVYEIEERRHFFFQSPTHSFLMRDVARAATAAPTYFPPVTLPITRRFSAKGYVAVIDGGVFANNPAPYALASAAAVRPGSRDVLLVSLGTGALPPAMGYGEAWSWGMWRWAASLISIVFSDHGVDEAFRNVLPADRYFRFQPRPDGVRRNPDDASPENLRMLRRLAGELIDERKRDLENLSERLRSGRSPECPPRLTAEVFRAGDR